MSDPSMEIDSVRLNNTHIRITVGPAKDDPPFEVQYLGLWGNGDDPNSKPIPATIPLTGAKVTANIMFTNNQPLEYILSVAVRGRQVGTTERTPYSAVGITSVDIDVPIAPSAAPWGSGGNLDWTMDMYCGDQKTTLTKTTNIQLYAIAGDMTPMYKKQGIPQDMLDLFVDQYNNTGSSTMNDWIEWVVTRCHASTDDSETSNAIHSYTYNTFCGAARFSAVTKFDLLGWLKLRQNDSPLVMVNCLDQCSLAISALNLGLPYYLRGQDGQIVTSNNTQLTTLQRFYKGTDDDNISKRFGFINTLDLVGWGNCNNPFFSENTANIIIPDRSNTPNAKRESFRNHYFVCYNTIDSNSGAVVQNALDACAGPANDPTVTLNDYLTHAIDAVASRNYSGNGWEIFGEVVTLDPTNTMNMLTLFTPSIKSKWKGGILWNALVKAQGSRPDPSTPIGASLTGLAGALNAINVQTSEFDVDIGKDRSSIDVEFSQNSVSFARATIDVMKDFESAQLQAESRQFDMQRDWDTVFAIPVTTQYLGDVNLVTKGELNVAMIIYGNVVIYLEGGDGPQNQFNQLVQSIDGYMKEARKTVFNAIDTSIFAIDMPAEQNMGAKFYINITCPGISDLEIASESDIVQFTKGPNSVSGEVWSATCKAYEAGSDRVAFGFAQTGTYYPFTDLVKTINITAS